MTVPVDTLAATVREGFASGRSIFAKDAADEALTELVARATQAEADLAHLSSEYHFDMDRGDHLVYAREWDAFNAWQRGDLSFEKRALDAEAEAARLRNDLKIAYEDHEIAEARLREERDMHLRARANLVEIAGKKEERAEAAEAATEEALRRVLDEKARCARLQQALAWYADENNWTQPTSWGGRLYDDEAPGPRDCGKVAREALAATEGADTGPDTPADRLPCGHPLGAAVTADEGTSYCGKCADRQPEETTT